MRETDYLNFVQLFLKMYSSVGGLVHAALVTDYTFWWKKSHAVQTGSHLSFGALA